MSFEKLEFDVATPSLALRVYAKGCSIIARLIFVISYAGLHFLVPLIVGSIGLTHVLAVLTQTSMALTPMWVSVAVLALVVVWSVYDATRLRGFFDQASWRRPIATATLATSSALGALIDRGAQLRGKPSFWGAPMPDVKGVGDAPILEMGAWSAAGRPVREALSEMSYAARLAPLLSINALCAVVGCLASVCLLPLYLMERAIERVITGKSRRLLAKQRPSAGV